MQLTGQAVVAGLDPFTQESTPSQQLGASGFDSIGRKYKYSKIGAANIAAGHLLQTSARDTNFTDLVVYSASAIGAFTVTATLGGTAVTADMFKDGILAVTAGTGLGYTLAIKSHTVQAGTTGNVTFTLYEPLKIAIDTTTRVTPMKNPYDGVVDSPTTATGITMGVGMFVATAKYYTWIGVQGYFAVLASTTVQAIGGGVQAKNSSTAGAANILAAAGYQIGGAPILGVDTEYQIVFLNCG